jgi:hypothetical protein
VGVRRCLDWMCLDMKNKGGFMKWFIVVALLLFTTPAFADVTATILAVDKDDNGNIMVKTAYYVDGKNLESRYPQMMVKDSEGKDVATYYWVTRYNCINFSGKTDIEKQALIDKDLTAFADVQITRPLQIAQAEKVKVANDTLIKSKVFTDMVGHTVTVTEAKLQVDDNFDGKPDTELTVKTDGTYTEKAITP